MTTQVQQAPLSWNETFFRSLDRLSRQDQDAVRATIFDFSRDPSAPGFDYHALSGARDRNFASFRVNSDIRVIVYNFPDTRCICYVDHHDAAYLWGEKYRGVVNRATGAMQFVHVVEREEEIVRQVYTEAKPAIFARFEAGYLSDLGVPEEWLLAVRHFTEDDFLANVEKLPAEAAERLMSLASGHVVPTPAKVEVADPLLHPDARRRFRRFDSDDALKKALEAPWNVWSVFLHPSQERLATATYHGPARVTGGAGTGKTVVALHRAASLARQNETARILLTTYTRVLTNDISRLLDVLLDKGTAERARVSVANVHQVAREEFQRLSGGRQAIIAEAGVVESYLAQAGGDLEPDTFPVGFLVAEWRAVIEPAGITSIDAYRDADRTGRGVPLNGAKRAAAWAVFSAVLDRLAAERKTTWSLLCHDVAARLAETGGARYNHVIADEAQDFGPGELRLIRALVAPADNDLFFVGDGGQRIYRGRASWLSQGIDIRGRSSRLVVNYRTTEQIRRFAEQLAAGASDPGDASQDTPVERDSVSLMTGPNPTLRKFTSEREEFAWLASEIRALTSSTAGFVASEIGVFARTNALCGLITASLEQATVPARRLDDTWTESPAVSVGTMHRAKGLEFRVVFVASCSDQLLPLSGALRDASDPADHDLAAEGERQLLYVATSRARERLYVSYSGHASRFLTPAN
jgi:mRNA-degrading endonuclease RelE of RelBE toxin-antitoxin system